MDTSVKRWSLDGELWTVGVGLWSLYAGLWTLVTFVDWFRTESELSFWFWLDYAKLFEWQSQSSYDHAYSVEGKGSDVVIFRNSILTLSLTLQKYANYIASSYFTLFRSSRPQPSIYGKFLQKICVLETFF